MLRDIEYKIPPLWRGMGPWTYHGEKEVESDGHNAKMWHYLIAPDGKRIDIDQFFGSYHLPSDEEVEDLIMELPEVRRCDMKIKPVWNFHR